VHDKHSKYNVLRVGVTGIGDVRLVDGNNGNRVLDVVAVELDV